jgi:hypothetical protein
MCILLVYIIQLYYIALCKEHKISKPKSILGFLTPEDGTDKLSRNVGKKLPLLTA